MAWLSLCLGAEHKYLGQGPASQVSTGPAALDPTPLLEWQPGWAPEPEDRRPHSDLGGATPQWHLHSVHPDEVLDPGPLCLESPSQILGACWAESLALDQQSPWG